jgi:hypothetical protein
MLDQTLNEAEAEERDAYEDNQEEPVAMIEESPPDVGQDADDEHGIDSSWTVVGTPVLRVKTIYISSAIPLQRVLSFSSFSQMA